MSKVKIAELTNTSQILVKRLQDTMIVNAEFLPVEVQELLDECFFLGVKQAEDDCDCSGEYDEGYARGFDDGEESGYEAGKNER